MRSQLTHTPPAFFRLSGRTIYFGSEDRLYGYREWLRECAVEGRGRHV